MQWNPLNDRLTKSMFLKIYTISTSILIVLFKLINGVILILKKF